MELVITMNDGSQYLAHHGIKGMKWGVRRYQNPDGTLTSDGRRRYNIVARSEKNPGPNARKVLEKYDRFTDEQIKLKDDVRRIQTEMDKAERRAFEAHEMAYRPNPTKKQLIEEKTADLEYKMLKDEYELYRNKRAAQLFTDKYSKRYIRDLVRASRKDEKVNR